MPQHSEIAFHREITFSPFQATHQLVYAKVKSLVDQFSTTASCRKDNFSPCLLFSWNHSRRLSGNYMLQSKSIKYLITFKGWLVPCNKTSLLTPLFTVNCIFSFFMKTFGKGFTNCGKRKGTSTENCPLWYSNFCDHLIVANISSPPPT